MFLLKISSLEAGEMAQQLRELVTFSENPGSKLSHGGEPSIMSVPGSLKSSFSDLHVAHIHKHR